VKGELIAGDVVRLERDRLLQGAPPDLERLTRQPIDQIDRDRIEASRTGDLYAPPRLLGSMPAAEEPQGVGVERLNPERKEADAEIAPCANALRVYIFRIGLEGDPGAVLNRKVSTGGCEDAGDILRRERRGGAAAEVDRVDGIKRGTVRGPERDLGNQVIGETPPPFRPAGQDREVAVRADGGAEGDVEI
jgi:hypothetical protein